MTDRAEPRKRVPTILTADEILDKAFRKVNKIDKQGPDKVELVKRKSMARIASATDVISSTLQKYVKAFPSINDRGDFLAEMIEVTVGVDRLKKALGNLDWASSKIKELQKQYTSKVMTSSSVFAADNARKAFYGRASSVVNKIGPDLDFLTYARNEFRKVPDFDDDMLTFVIAGFPNVGKSQFLRTISAAEPEVAAYPFTTKGIEVGIHEANHRRSRSSTPPVCWTGSWATATASRCRRSPRSSTWPTPYCSSWTPRRPAAIAWRGRCACWIPSRGCSPTCRCWWWRKRWTSWTAVPTGSR